MNIIERNRHSTIKTLRRGVEMAAIRGLGLTRVSAAATVTGELAARSHLPSAACAMKSDRWRIAAAGVLLQMALGGVYAWSVFRTPLAIQFGWSISQITLTFTITILALACAAFAGGVWLNRSGPRVVAVTGGVLYGLGVFLASLTDRIEWLYATYGLLGGIGLGFGYIVPLAVLVKWFPDRRGLITGIAVGGFGAGALVTAPIATALIESVGVLRTFACLGLAYLVLAPLAGWFMRNPPEGWSPHGKALHTLAIGRHPIPDFTLRQALRTRQWWILWLILFLNVSAGISLISQQAPLYQELAGVSAAVAAGMVGMASIGNALGRVFWAWLSDHLTRRSTFMLLFLIQVALFWILPDLGTVPALTLAALVILSCFGGGFGTMPASVTDYFGPKNVGPIYGLMLTAWGLASLFGPMLLAGMREITGSYQEALHIIAALMTLSTLLPCTLRTPAESPLTGRSN
jgi:OFA family oxalate/formate antiporter-like MFS transporter